MLSTMASGVPPTTSTELMSVGYLVKPSRPIRPAGTVKPMSVSETCRGDASAWSGRGESKTCAPGQAACW